MELKQYKGASDKIRAYWRINGGFRDLVASPYFGAALLLCIPTLPQWTQPGWWDVALQVLPGVLGFSIGGFAIFLAFGDPQFRSLIAGSVEGQTARSPYIKFCATFSHFIVVQVAAILLALVSKSTPLASLSLEGAVGATAGVLAAVWYGLGFFAFLYALLLSIAVVLNIFMLAHTYDAFHTRLRAQALAKSQARAQAGGQGESAGSPSD